MGLTKLNGLRGIFSLSIAFFHYPKEYMPEWIYSPFFIRQSFTFSDFFFVLSGFVNSYDYNSLADFKDFGIYIKKGLIRLYQLLLFSLVLYSKWLLRGFISFNLRCFVWELNKIKFKINNKIDYLIPILLLVILYLNFWGRTNEKGLILGTVAIPLFFSLSILTLLKADETISKIRDMKPFQYLGKTLDSMCLIHRSLIKIILPPIYTIFKVEIIHFKPNNCDYNFYHYRNYFLRFHF
jgi:peptidoglycan/LPS O-acetylase OafA/YrhL